MRGTATRLIPAVWLSLLGSLCLRSPAQAYGDSTRVTMTLLAVQQAGSVGDQLWIQEQPAQAAFLKFDLSRLPASLTRKRLARCTLRIVASEVAHRPADNLANAGSPTALIEVQQAADDLTALPGKTPNVTRLSTLSVAGRAAASHKTVAVTPDAHAERALCDVIFQRYAAPEGPRNVTLRLSTRTRDASSLLFGIKAEPSQAPRLVLTYEEDPAPLLESTGWHQYQHDAAHTGNHPWQRFGQYERRREFDSDYFQSDYTLSSYRQNGPLAFPPLIYRERLYFVRKAGRAAGAENRLVAMDTAGAELWSEPIGGGTVQRAPAVSRQGIFYVVTETSIDGYDLHQHGKRVASYPLASGLKPSAYTELTVGDDGSLFLALQAGAPDLNYLVALTPTLKPFLQDGPHTRISTPSLTEDGRELIAATEGGALVVNVADPSLRRVLEFSSLAQLHAPLAGKSGFMIFSDYADVGTNQGAVRVMTASSTVWKSSAEEGAEPNAEVASATPQPVVDASLQQVYFLQGGALHERPYFERGRQLKCGSELRTTSNLVIDAAGSVLFSEYGQLRAFRSAYRRDRGGCGDFLVLHKDLPHEKAVRWTLAADGSVWTSNEQGDRVFVLRPRPLETLVLGEHDLMFRRSYWAKSLTIGPVKVLRGSQMLWQASQQVSFARGFHVERGASLLVRLRSLE